MKKLIFVYYNFYIKRKYGAFGAKINAFFSFVFLIIINLFTVIAYINIIFNLNIIAYFVNGDTFSNRSKIAIAIVPVFIFAFISAV